MKRYISGICGGFLSLQLSTKQHVHVWKPPEARERPPSRAEEQSPKVILCCMNWKGRETPWLSRPPLPVHFIRPAVLNLAAHRNPSGTLEGTHTGI